MCAAAHIGGRGTQQPLGKSQRFEYFCNVRPTPSTAHQATPPPPPHPLPKRKRHASVRAVLGKAHIQHDEGLLSSEDDEEGGGDCDAPPPPSLPPRKIHPPSRKVYSHPTYIHAEQLSKWIREERVGPILFDQRGVDPCTMQLASWRRIVSQAGAVESMTNSERRKIWKYMRDPKHDITSRHLFLSCGMTAGQICCFYEITKSIFNMSICETVQNAIHTEAAHGSTRTQQGMLF